MAFCASRDSTRRARRRSCYRTSSRSLRPKRDSRRRTVARCASRKTGSRRRSTARTIIEIPPQVYRARLVGMFFDTSKSFLLPGGALHGIRRLTSYLDQHPSAQLLVVGHTDTAGDSDYNLTLSVERAKAIAAYLKDDVDAWVAWFDDDKPPAKRWGTLEIQRMLSVLPDGEDTKFYSVSPPTGRKDASTRDAVESFQRWSNQTKGTSLDVDGDPGPATRPEIVRAYMAIEGTSVSDSTVLKTHGCGEFHPQNPTPDGVADPENRRVEIFVFEDVIDPQPQECRSPGCSQYQQWVDKLVETIDFNTEDLPDTPLVGGRLPTLYSPGKSFPKPSALPMLREVVKRMAADEQLHALVMGHTDASVQGDEAAEASIARARAEAISMLLRADQDPFLKKFSSSGDDAWGWEEVQWMLSAVQVEGEPCYVGVVDGHRGDAVLQAIEAFQVWNALKLNRRVNDATLKKLVEEYFKLVTNETTAAIVDERIAVVSGGSWHPPRSFGDASAQLEGDEFAQNNFLSFRRVEVFLSRVLLVPPTDTCSPSRHEKCHAYEEWCKDSKEALPDDGLHDFSIRVTDSLTRPIEGCSVELTSDQEAAGSSSTSALGTVLFRLARGFYTAAFTAGGFSQRASFLLDQDNIGGLMIRLDRALPDPNPRPTKPVRRRLPTMRTAVRPDMAADRIIITPNDFSPSGTTAPGSSSRSTSTASLAPTSSSTPAHASSSTTAICISRARSENRRDGTRSSKDGQKVTANMGAGPDPANPPFGVGTGVLAMVEGVIRRTLGQKGWCFKPTSTTTNTGAIKLSLIVESLDDFGNFSPAFTVSYLSDDLAGNLMRYLVFRLVNQGVTFGGPGSGDVIACNINPTHNSGAIGPVLSGGAVTFHVSSEDATHDSEIGGDGGKKAIVGPKASARALDPDLTGLYEAYPYDENGKETTSFAYDPPLMVHINQAGNALVGWFSPCATNNGAKQSSPPAVIPTACGCFYACAAPGPDGRRLCEWFLQDGGNPARNETDPDLQPLTLKSMVLKIEDGPKDDVAIGITMTFEDRLTSGGPLQSATLRLRRTGSRHGFRSIASGHTSTT